MCMWKIRPCHLGRNSRERSHEYGRSASSLRGDMPKYVRKTRIWSANTIDDVSTDIAIDQILQRT